MGAKKYQEELDRRKLKVISNIVQSHLKEKKNMDAKTCADIGLRILERSGLADKAIESKFWYMKGVANTERGFSEDAVEALKKANAASPGDKAVTQLLSKAFADRKSDKETAKEVWKDHLRTEVELKCARPWWDIRVLPYRCKQRCQHRSADASKKGN